MSALQPVRGTRDMLPDEARAYQELTGRARELAERYGYLEIMTPIFEFTEVFKRTLGDTSDVVTKEMYTFSIKEGEQITLRPENTAGVARALMSNGLQQHLPLKYFYAGPMFRHERPQKGRQRQFHQCGVELLGAAGPEGDVEILSLGRHLLDVLGIADNTILELNTLGDPESRQAYREALTSYFSDYKDKLSKDSLDRLERNPLRILDSKDEGDRELVKDAPVFGEYLNQDSQDFFAKVLEGLDNLGIAYQLNPRLVRGLDYYTHTAFEFTTNQLGAQGTVLAGGRYDGLMDMMGGKPTPGVGWAAGIERLMMLSGIKAKTKRPVAVIPMSREAEANAYKLAGKLRIQSDLPIEIAYSGNAGKRFKRADKMNCKLAVLLRATDHDVIQILLRNLDTGEQGDEHFVVDFSDLSMLVERLNNEYLD